ncbi:hypothetical protein [Paenibacillus turpanensis]|uniref:hypothetical protein n=1 Tax=Paenibacillus turpanensis TaxID=2689078 RepID=UPI00140E4101|nr:hypothetical protein [Paenibacillus turpanensis]
MRRKQKQSISTFLISALAFLFACKAFVWVLESQIVHTTIHIPELNYAIIGVSIALLLRIGFVWMRAKGKNVSKSDVSFDSNQEEASYESNEYSCAACGKSVSEKVRQYCLSKPNRFKGNVYCYNHQVTHSS